MDLTSFKLDIDDLLDEFTEGKFTTLADMKKMWIAKKFSYIYEARPTANSAVFMQSLFAHSISHMVSTSDLSRRLGGLYYLYCLYETQPYKPCFKIYLSLRELKMLKALVLDAKENGIGVVPALVRRMLDKDMFLFGFVDIVDASVNQRVDEYSQLHEKRVQIAYERLLSKTRIDEYLHMDLGVKLEMEALKEMSMEYAKAKELAIKDAKGKVEVEDIKHIAENKKTIGETINHIVEEWNAQKEAFYKESGVGDFPGEIVPFESIEEDLMQLLNN